MSEPMENTNQAPPPAAGAAALPRVGSVRPASRRQFLRAGLITGPLVVTLASRPASALIGPSVGFSGNISRFGRDRTNDLEGRTPGFWRMQQHFQYWTAPYTPGVPTVVGSGKAKKIVLVGGTLFKDVFDDAFPGKTLHDVVMLEGNEDMLEALGRHTVAALLNAAHPEIFYRFAVATVINLFNATYPDGDLAGLKNLFERENEREGGLDI